MHYQKMAASLQFILLGLAIFIAVFLNYPAADFSSDLKKWSESGYYFNYKGYAIFYKDDVGVGRINSVVLCIHGFPTNSHDWVKIWGQLKGKFGRVIAADMLGHGFSDKPLKQYTVFEQADIHEQLLEHLDIHQVHLLTHDLGDTVAQEMLARFEERKRRESSNFTTKLEILSLCLSNGGIFPELNIPRPIQKLALIPWIGPTVARLSSFTLFASRFGFTSIFGPLTEPTDLELKDFWAVMRHKDGHILAPRILQYINQRKVNRKRWVGVLETTSIPVHLIYGPADPINPPQMLQRYRELVSHGTATVLAPTIGHYPQWEDPSAFIEGYLKFVSKFE